MFAVAIAPGVIVLAADFAEVALVLVLVGRAGALALVVDAVLAPVDGGALVAALAALEDAPAVELPACAAPATQARDGHRDRHRGHRFCDRGVGRDGCTRTVGRIKRKKSLAVCSTV